MLYFTDRYLYLAQNKGRMMLATKHTEGEVYTAFFVERVGWVEPSNMQQPPYVSCTKPHLAHPHQDEAWIRAVKKWCKNHRLLVQEFELIQKKRTVI